MEYIKLIIMPLLIMAGGWVGNWITNAPKREDASINRLNLVMNQYDKIIEENNRTIKHLKQKITEIQGEKREQSIMYQEKINKLKHDNKKLEQAKEACEQKLKGG